jgi:hypothetical protein
LTEDAEQVDAEPTPAQWRLFEQQVRRVLEEFGDGAKVEYDAHIQGRLSNTERQVDVLVRGRLVGQEMTIVCECKRYTTKSVGIGMVDEMVGKVMDIGANSGIMYAFNGYTRNAKARAAGALNPKIELRELPAEAELDYAEFFTRLKFGDCANPNCITGDVRWELWPDPDGGPPVRAGFCNTCGILAVECSDEDCGAITALDHGEQQCDNCEAVYLQVTDYKGEFENVVWVT